MPCKTTHHLACDCREERIAGLVAALEFYENPPQRDEHGERLHIPDFYDAMDFGETARKALKTYKGEES